MEKSLVECVFENWEVYTSAFNISLENKKENYFVLMRELNPFIELLSFNYKVPSVAVYSSCPQNNIEDYDFLTSINLLKKDYHLFGLTSSGVDLLNAYKTMKNQPTGDSITKHILENTKSF